MNFENQTSNIPSAAMLEQLSACMDGELTGVELDQLLAQLPDLAKEGVLHTSVQSYLSIGETLRSSYTSHTSSVAWLCSLQTRIAQEPPLRAIDQPKAGVVAVPAVQKQAQAAPESQVTQDSANHAVFRWKLVAGLASVAAVAMVGWNSASMLSGQAGKAGSGQQLAGAGIQQMVASAQPASGGLAAGQGLVQTPVTVGQNSSIMLRDPRLDELLAARGQIGGTANLQMPAGFLRNATFNAEKKPGCPDKNSRLC